MNAVIEKLRLDKHHRIEQFAVEMCVLWLIMFLILLRCGATLRARDKNILSSRAILSNYAITSLSDQTINVIDMYRNEESSRVFVLCRFKDPDNLPSMASDYQVYYSARAQHLGYTPDVCTVFMDSAHGYFGMYFRKSDGFKPQVVDLTVRVLTNVVPLGVNTRYHGDKSFSDYDQFRIYVNPGASGAKPVKFLEKEDFTFDDVYRVAISPDDEKDIKQKMQDDIRTMRNASNSMNEYFTRLDSMGIQVPGWPPLFMSDSFDKDAQTGSLVYDTDDVVTGGVQANWDTMTLAEGNYTELVGAKNPNKKIRKMRKARRDLDGNVITDGKDSYRLDGFEIPEHWYYKDTGSEFIVRNIANISASSPEGKITKAINDYTNAADKYYKAKVDYQFTLPIELLEAEADARNSDLLVSSNSKNSMIVWEQK